MLSLEIVLCDKLFYFSYLSCWSCLQTGCDECWEMRIENTFTFSVQSFFLWSLLFKDLNKKASAIILYLSGSEAGCLCCLCVLAMSLCPCRVHLLKFSAYSFVEFSVPGKTIFCFSFFKNGQIIGMNFNRWDCILVIQGLAEVKILFQINWTNFAMCIKVLEPESF